MVVKVEILTEEKEAIVMVDVVHLVILDLEEIGLQPIAILLAEGAETLLLSSR